LERVKETTWLEGYFESILSEEGAFVLPKQRALAPLAASADDAQSRW
jgi:hypothetical protein